jgi:hypothetical protein
MSKTLDNTNENFAGEVTALERARNLAELAKQVPSILDDIASLEKNIAPFNAELKAKKATLKQFMIDAELDEFATDNGFVLNLIQKVRRNLNVDLVQKAISKTQWNRILLYVDPNGGKRPKMAFTETTSPTLTIKAVEVEVGVEVEA